MKEEMVEGRMRGKRRRGTVELESEDCGVMEGDGSEEKGGVTGDSERRTVRWVTGLESCECPCERADQ